MALTRTEFALPWSPHVPRTVYVVGGAGVGKSTFVAAATERHSYGPLKDLYTCRSSGAHLSKVVIDTLRGHPLTSPSGAQGVYLGVVRPLHPGTDGLARSVGPVGEQWLKQGLAPAYVVGEGATLAGRRFINALAAYTEFMLVHLHVDPVIADLRCYQRGTTQPDSFVLATATRSAKLAAEVERSRTAQVLHVDTADPTAWDAAIVNVRAHLARQP